MPESVCKPAPGSDDTAPFLRVPAPVFGVQISQLSRVPYCDVGIHTERVSNHEARFLPAAEHVLFACLTNETMNAVRTISDAETIRTRVPASVAEHGRAGSASCSAA